MDDNFDYPIEGWKAESNYDASDLGLAISKIATQAGITTNILNASNPSMIGWDKVVQFSGVHIIFINQDYGCTLNVMITDKEKIEKSFFFLWKHFIDKGIFWGGPYVKAIATTNSELNVQEDILRNYNEKEAMEIKKRNAIVFRWLDRKNEYITKTLDQFLDDYRDTFYSKKAFYHYQKKMYEERLIDKKRRQYCIKKK